VARFGLILLDVLTVLALGALVALVIAYAWWRVYVRGD